MSFGGSNPWGWLPVVAGAARRGFAPSDAHEPLPKPGVRRRTWGEGSQRMLDLGAEAGGPVPPRAPRQPSPRGPAQRGRDVSLGVFLRTKETKLGPLHSSISANL